ncbi:winged helix-turn-helix domain-containing protein [Pseudoalteromonas luteoviolacea]|uniref:winged helix-turn-helix domain-containing protein n=1 Tax=Pseudoalteromonas luteoviolacea TaxID=43657 RepID=UPI0011519C44|nr:winged helix-turn-helix domain-containing protein [Pseudoalteromonas luteoviolacea]TQF66768.1 hypothetical protein FLM44_24640 [Pseudoalteromonas luteoviolacea]
MKKQFISLGYRVDGHTFSVENAAGERLKIRPKTCQLLLVLMENHQQVLSKHKLLELVWPNVVVDEQVVFQSVKEIRQIFQPHEVIKTLPTQGYQWIAPVKTHSYAGLFSLPPSVIIFAGCLLLSGIVYFGMSQLVASSSGDALKQIEQSAAEQLQGSIVILPTQNLVAGNDYDWVRLGFMDQLIQRLPSEPSFGVLQTDYVMEVMSRAGMRLSSAALQSSNSAQQKVLASDYSDHDIEQIFTVSGAQLIVVSKLMGTPHDYQLSYKLYWPHKNMQGVIFGSDTRTLLDELAIRLKRLTGSEVALETHSYHSDFFNEMMGRALELKLQGDIEGAVSLLQALITQTPQNITARRVLIELQLSQRHLGQALSLLEKSIPIAKVLENHHELIRLGYLHALHAAMKHELPLAKARVNAVAQLAKEHKDWLYLAYSVDLLGHIAMRSNQFDTAKALYSEAKSYHQILRCPVGEATSWLNLAKLAQQMEVQDMYDEALDNATDIARARSLNAILNEINEFKNK